MPLSSNVPITVAPETITITSPVDVSLTGAGNANKDSVFAVNANRKRAVISAGIANDQTIRVGDTDVDTDQGIQLAAGEAVAIDTTAEIFVCEEVAGTTTVGLLEEVIA